MQETELAQPSEPFLQGDIIHLLDSAGQSADPRYGIIINADCDLAHCKIDGVVSYLPLYSFDTYLRQFWIPMFIVERETELLQSIAQICGLDPSTLAGLRNWINEEEAESIASKLSTSYSVKHSIIRTKILELSVIARSPLYDINLVYKLLEIQEQNRRQAISKLAKRALRALGDGHFFLNEIIGVSAVGFVARMRRVYSINSERVFASLASFRLSKSFAELNAVRIARLSNLYRFKVAQLFSYQFSRIGLPDEITSLNEIAAEAAIVGLEVEDA